MRQYNLLFLLMFIFSSSSMANDALRTATAVFESSAKEQTLDGVIEAVNKATMSSQVSGRITEILVDVDDIVNKGDVIVRVRNTEYKARLKNAKATRKEARANLKEAQLELKRITGLYKDNMVSASVFDKAKAQLKSNEARVSASEARVTETNEQFTNTTIRAPYSGIVVNRHIEVGETIQPGQAVMTGFSLDKLRVSVDVPQSYINAVRSHKTARIILLNSEENSQEETATVKNMTIFPFADPNSHTFHVRVNLNNGVKSLYPGMLVKVAFKIDETERLLIPLSSVVHRSEVIAIYVLDENNKIKLRQIRLGHTFGNNVEVLAGLNEGEKVALNPVKAGVMLKQSNKSSAESK